MLLRRRAAAVATPWFPTSNGETTFSARAPPPRIGITRTVDASCTRMHAPSCESRPRRAPTRTNNLTPRGGPGHLPAARSRVINNVSSTLRGIIHDGIRREIHRSIPTIWPFKVTECNLYLPCYSLTTNSSGNTRSISPWENYYWSQTNSWMPLKKKKARSAFAISEPNLRIQIGPFEGLALVPAGYYFQNLIMRSFFFIGQS